MKKTLLSIATTITLLAVPFDSRSIAAEYELTPNPNSSQNTITVASGDVGVNSADPFTNFGAIHVESGGTLRNVGQMDVTIIETISNLSSVVIAAGGLLDARAGSQMNFDSVSTFTVNGTVDNLGGISSDWVMTLGESSQFNNGSTGVVNNKKGGNFQGTFVNNGSFINSTPGGGGAGGYFQQNGDFQNQAGASILNQGVVFNYATITNHGSISNEVNFNTGVGRGEFTNSNLGTLSNESDGSITNRQSWFNEGSFNNAGFFINHQSGLGLSNLATGGINNLAGGTFQNDSSMYNIGQITNAGTFYAGSVTGNGTYEQTAGETIVDKSFHTATASFLGGLVSGNGTLSGPTVQFGEAATLSPGHSAGLLTFSGDLMMDGTLLAEIESLSRYDTIIVGGILTLGSTSVLDVSLLSGFVPTNTMSFDLVQSEQIVGSFGSIVLPASLSSQFRLVHLVDYSGTTDVLRFVAVPEPSVAGLLVSALGLAMLRRRRVLQC